MTAVGLRELKKAQTRQVIADTAAELFHRHGFDAVTVEEIATAAQVSKKTVFNYFPAKEDLFFARADDREAAILAAARESAFDGRLLEAFRELCLGYTRAIPGLRTGASRTHLDLVATTPALQRRMHEINARLTSSLATTLAEQTGLAMGDPLLEVVADTLITTQRTLFHALHQRVGRGGTDAAIIRAHRRDVNRVFDQLGSGLAHLHGRSRPR